MIATLSNYVSRQLIFFAADARPFPANEPATTGFAVTVSKVGDDIVLL